VRDYAQVRHDGRITATAVADKALAMLEIDENWLDEMDKRILEAVIHEIRRRAGGREFARGRRRRGTGPRSRKFTSRILIMEGYLNRTSQGRVATELSYKKLGLNRRRETSPNYFSAARLLNNCKWSKIPPRTCTSKFTTRRKKSLIPADEVQTKTTSSKENWQAKRAPYTWHFRPPFDKEFDRTHWWKKLPDSKIGQVAALYE